MPVAPYAGTDVIPVTTAPLTSADQPAYMVKTGTSTQEQLCTQTWQVKYVGQAITAATGIAVKTPAAGKKWRLLGWDFTNSSAASATFEDNAGASVWQTGNKAAAGANVVPPNFVNGVLAAVADTALWLDVSVTGNITGTIWGMEE